jgi:hypothetical protein
VQEITRDRRRGLAAQIVARWNRITAWLGELDLLRRGGDGMALSVIVIVTFQYFRYELPPKFSPSLERVRMGQIYIPFFLGDHSRYHAEYT